MSILARPPNRSRVHKINVKYEQTLRILTGLKHIMRTNANVGTYFFDQGLSLVLQTVQETGRRSRKNKNNAIVYLTIFSDRLALPWYRPIDQLGYEDTHTAIRRAIQALKADWAMELKEAGVQ